MSDEWPSVFGLRDTLRSIIRDPSGDVWTNESIYFAILDAQRAVVNVRPDTCVSYTTQILVAGSAQQALTFGMPINRILRVIGQMADEGEGIVRAVRRVEREAMDAANPSWMSDTPSTVIKEWLYDDREPHRYFVWPPVPPNDELEFPVRLRMSISFFPFFATNEPDTISTLQVPGNYLPAVTEFSLYRLFCADTEGTVNLDRSQRHFSNFNQMMGVKIDTDAAISPKERSHDK